MSTITDIQNKLAEKVLDCSFIVHKELGPGLLESVYEECLARLFDKDGISYERQKKMPVRFMDETIEVGFKADFIIDSKVIIELKSVEVILPIHTAQLLTYMKLSDINLGLLLNFNVPMLRNGIKRLVL